jgi:hypothetical protein
MRVGSSVPECAGTIDALIGADLPEWWGARHSERMGNTPSSTSAVPPEHQGWFQGRRRPRPSPRPAGQSPGLRRPARLPAGPAGGRLERPPARRPPRHHPAGHPPRHHRPPHPPATAAPAARPPAPARRPAARRCARTAELGFASVWAYLVDRLGTQAWTLEEVVGELGIAPATVRGLLDRYQVRRAAPTRRQRAAAAAASGPRQQARAVERRRARLAELGFTAPEAYLQDRSVRRGWSVRRLCAELGVGHGWLDSSSAGSGCAADRQSRDGGRRPAVGVEAGGLLHEHAQIE